MSSKEPVFRISFICQETTFEIYARQVCESDMFGFIEVEEFVFGETSQLLVDPSEEKLKLEFNNVKRTYIPMHSILRIDEMTKEGVSKAIDNSDSKVSNFPSPYTKKRDGK